MLWVSLDDNVSIVQYKNTTVLFIDGNGDIAVNKKSRFFSDEQLSRAQVRKKHSYLASNSSKLL